MDKFFLWKGPNIKTAINQGPMRKWNKKSQKQDSMSWLCNIHLQRIHLVFTIYKFTVHQAVKICQI